MDSPIILLTAGRTKSDGSSHFRPVAPNGVNYVNAILRAGGIPVVVPEDLSLKQIKDLFKISSGLCLGGGDDIDPKFYGEKINKKTAHLIHCEKMRDKMEFDLLSLFKRSKKPVLGICRGMQVLNVAFGGTLIQDIPAELKTKIRHKVSTEKEKRGIVDEMHSTELLSNTSLMRFLKTKTIMANSRHHQSVKRVADRFIVNAMAPDGIIEGIEYKTMKERWILGVQWHPESMEDASSKRLFKVFIEKARSS